MFQLHLKQCSAAREPMRLCEWHFTRRRFESYFPGVFALRTDFIARA